MRCLRIPDMPRVVQDFAWQYLHQRGSLSLSQPIQREASFENGEGFLRRPGQALC